MHQMKLCLLVTPIPQGITHLLQTQEMWSFIIPVGLVGLHMVKGGQQLSSLQVLLAGAAAHAPGCYCETSQIALWTLSRPLGDASHL